METISVQKQVPVVGEYDVVVCGGGPSGIMAATAAARSGAKVALIERYGFLGGMATAGLVNPISVFRYNGELVVGGIPWELVMRMEAKGDAQVEYPLGNISYKTEAFKLEAQRMVLEAGAELYLHAFISGCQKDENNRITHVIYETKSGSRALKGEYFIDCTGDGDLCEMAGVPMQKHEGPLQPASMCFRLGGVETDKLDRIHHSQQGLNYHMEDLRDKLHALAETEEIPNFGGPWMCWMMVDGEVVVNCTRIQANMVDEREQTRAECQLREDVHRMVKLFRENYEPLRNCYLIETSAQAGVRETRHILGAHILTGQEYVTAYEFEDAIGRGCHPIDIHASGTTEQRCSFLEKPAYIPYRSLYAADFPNLLVGGRCFSADREASASVRVMASVMGLGQAAGLAAAMCVKSGAGVNEVDVQALRETLRAWGAKV